MTRASSGNAPGEHEVRFPEGESGSSLLYGLLCEARTRWPEALADAPLGDDARAFKSGYPRSVVDFEAARVAAPERLEIGRYLVQQSQARLRFGDAPLEEVLAAPAPAPALDVLETAGSGRLAPAIPYHGRVHTGSGIEDLAERLLAEARLSRPAAEALRFVVRQGVDETGELDLAGRRVAILGAAAELAPTAQLLAAGADVLWIDVAAPPAALQKDSTASGRLFVPRGGSDLLRRPAETVAAIRAFAEDGPVDLGLYAYAPGKGQEWRLTGAMNAMVDALAGAVRSVGLLVSPTSPVVLTADTVKAARAIDAARPAWQRALERLRLVGPGYVPAGDRQLLRALVSVQGPTYQAAQYVGKILAAERFATTGPADAGAIAVSANVAAITMTRSLRHPVFEAAFLGAGAFGVEAFEPDTTRALNGLLWMHDLLNPDAPGSLDHEASPAERAAGLLRQQVHGGLYAIPWELEPAIRLAAVLGIARRPALLGGLAASVLRR